LGCLKKQKNIWQRSVFNVNENGFISAVVFLIILFNFLDTSFMYVMAVLIMVKLYQNRHPDINATAYSTFSVVGIAIFMG